MADQVAFIRIINIISFITRLNIRSNCRKVLTTHRASRDRETSEKSFYFENSIHHKCIKTFFFYLQTNHVNNFKLFHVFQKKKKQTNS